VLYWELAGRRPVPAGTYWVRLAAGGREIGRQKVLVVR
jgi:hypothetical protein